VIRDLRFYHPGITPQADRPVVSPFELMSATVTDHY